MSTPPFRLTIEIEEPPTPEVEELIEIVEEEELYRPIVIPPENFEITIGGETNSTKFSVMLKVGCNPSTDNCETP